MPEFFNNLQNIPPQNKNKNASGREFYALYDAIYFISN
jgi:hypothetical protein